MRKAVDKIKAIYGTEIGQDVLETLVAAGAIAATQAVATDMTPEEIALSSGIGISGAFVGRKLGADIGRYIGRRLDNNPSVSVPLAEGMQMFRNKVPEGPLRDALDLKLKPVANAGGAEQLGYLWGKGRGDNIVQLGIGAVSPLIFNSETDV